VSLTPGTRLGVYEIIAPIGAGGMGEVYRATDTNLKRQVAVKVLPSALAGDAERLARFQREAEVLASLNHPHIAQIHGLERSAGLTALVMELVEGDDLSRRIARGAIPLDEALPIVKQIAAALEAAHEQGIIHRDLKPANIKVRADGTVKVLDFGLAKALDASPASSTADDSPTITSPAMTMRGMILGTAAYMAPEQAKGKAVDRRADVWAFGTVLYEMLTGRRAFNGDDTTDTIVAVVSKEPDWGALPAATPAGLRQLLTWCLKKDARARLQAIGDARLLIEDAEHEPPPLSPVETNRRHASGRRWRLAAAVALVAAAAAIAGVVVARSLSPPARPAMLGPMSRLTSTPGLSTDPSISADGRLVAYASNRGGEGTLDIYVQQATGGSALRLTSDAADDTEPAVSPDGSLVVFRSARNPPGIYATSALGGEPRLVVTDGRSPKFSPDGRSIVYWTGIWIAPRTAGADRRTYVVPVAGGSPVRVAANLASAGDPVWAPDGQSLVVFGHETATQANTDPDWWWVPVTGGDAVRIGAYARFRARGINTEVSDEYPYPSAWTDAGVLFTAAGGTNDAQGLWLAAIDARTGRMTADPARLTNGTTSDRSPALSRGGTLLYSAQTVEHVTFALPLDANSGKVTGALQRVVRADGRTSVSIDGRWLALAKFELDTGGLWLRNLTTGAERQLAATPRTPLNPVLSADGRWVAYTVTKVDTGGSSGPGDGYVVATERGVPRKVCEDCIVENWAEDSRQVVIREPGKSALIRLDITSGVRSPLATASAGDFDRPMFGPGGRWFTFNTPRGIFVSPLHEDGRSAEAQWTQLARRTATSERTAGLSPDGRLLYVLLERDGFRCLYGIRLDPATGLPTGSGEPFLVAHFHDATRRWGSTGMGSAVARGVFLADLFETTGSIWMTTLTR